LHVLGTHPQTLGSTAPHVLGAVHVPQLMALPHPSLIIPQFTPCPMHVCGAHPLLAALDEEADAPPVPDELLPDDEPPVEDDDAAELLAVVLDELAPDVEVPPGDEAQAARRAARDVIENVRTMGTSILVVQGARGPGMASGCRLAVDTGPAGVMRKNRPASAPPRRRAPPGAPGRRG
jgi:hypothetical protein